MRALVIDADYALREFLSVVFKLEHIDAAFADSLEAARYMLRELTPDAIVIDAGVDDPGLRPFVASMRQQYPRAKLVLTSADITCRVDALALAMDSFVAKPFDIETIVSAIRSPAATSNTSGRAVAADRTSARLRRIPLT